MFYKKNTALMQQHELFYFLYLIQLNKG